MTNHFISEDVDRIVVLMEEIAIAQSKLQPQDTGHIHTAISYLHSRVDKYRLT